MLIGVIALKEIPLYWAWTLALIGVMGSLFFSEVMNFIPCSLCWYQRIFMYSLLLVLTFGIAKDKENTREFALVLSVPGLVLSIYHNLLQWGIIPKDITPCSQGVSCSDKWINWLGFISIPFLSMMAFAFITLFLFIFCKRDSEV